MSDLHHKPQSIGPYSIQNELGRGGMGVVWAALDERLQRRVAIKTLLPAKAKPGETQSLANADQRAASVRGRMLREARALAAIQHPSVAAVYDILEHEDAWYVVMELVGDSNGTAQTLSGRLVCAPLSLNEVLRMGAQVAGALGAAHNAGIFHRDLKPSNILFTASGDAKVVDFGLARTVAEMNSEESLTGSTMSGGPTIATQVWDEVKGQSSGTPGYMSPEQVQGRPADTRQDIFAFGCVLYEALTGVRAFRTDIPLSQQAPDWTRLPQPMPETLVELLRGCLAMDATRRLRDAGDIQIILERTRRDIEGERTPHDDSNVKWGSPSGGQPKLSRGFTDSLRQVIGSRLGGAGLCTLAASLLSWFLVLPQFVPRLPGIDRLSNSDAVAGISTPSAAVSTDAALPSVLVIGFEPGEPMLAVAKALGIHEGVLIEQRETWRPIHAAMLDKLVDAGASCVTFDIRFRTPEDSANDTALAASIARAVKGGLPVVVGASTWHRDQYGVPDTSEAILNAGAAWGTMLIKDATDAQTWTLDAGVVRLGMSQGNLGLSLETVIRSEMRPAFGVQSNMMIESANTNPTARVQLWHRRDGASIGERVRLGPEWRVALSSIRSLSSADFDEEPVLADSGYQIGDEVAEINVPVGKQPTLESITLKYTQVVTMTAAELAERVKDKIVLIGDMVDDIVPAPGGGKVPGVYSHASAVQALVRKAELREVPALMQLVWVVLVSASVSMIVFFTRRRLQSFVLCSMLMAMIVGVWLGGQSFFRGEWNVAYPITAVLLAFGLAWGLSEVRARRTHLGFATKQLKG